MNCTNTSIFNPIIHSGPCHLGFYTRYFLVDSSDLESWYSFTVFSRSAKAAIDVSRRGWLAILRRPLTICVAAHFVRLELDPRPVEDLICEDSGQQDLKDGPCEGLVELRLVHVSWS